MRRQILGLVALSVLSIPLAAQAIPTVLSDGDIKDLEVGGSVYDVEWIFGTENPVAGDFALFTGDAVFANLFMTEVQTAFLAAGFDGVDGQRYYGVDYGSLVGVFLDNAQDFELFDNSHGSWGGSPEAGFGRVSRVTAAAVPEPGTLSLLTAALAAGGFGFARRRRC